MCSSEMITPKVAKEYMEKTRAKHGIVKEGESISDSMLKTRSGFPLGYENLDYGRYWQFRLLKYAEDLREDTNWAIEYCKPKKPEWLNYTMEQ